MTKAWAATTAALSTMAATATPPTDRLAGGPEAGRVVGAAADVVGVVVVTDEVLGGDVVDAPIVLGGVVAAVVEVATAGAVVAAGPVAAGEVVAVVRTG